MALQLRAVYEDGSLRLLDRVALHNGQEVQITIQADVDDDTLRAVLGDLVSFPDLNDNRHAEIEAEAETIAKAFGVGKPLSEMIIEDRGER